MSRMPPPGSSLKKPGTMINRTECSRMQPTKSGTKITATTKISQTTIRPPGTLASSSGRSASTVPEICATKIRMSGAPVTGRGGPGIQQTTKVIVTGAGIKRSTVKAPASARGITTPGVRAPAANKKKCTAPCNKESSDMLPFTAEEEAGRHVPTGSYYMPMRGQANQNLSSPENLRSKMQKYTPTALSHYKDTHVDPLAKNLKPLVEQHPDMRSGYFRVKRGIPEDYVPLETTLMHRQLEQTIDPSLAESDWSLAMREAMALEQGDYEDEEDGQVYEVEHTSIERNVEAHGVPSMPKSPPPRSAQQIQGAFARTSPQVHGGSLAPSPKSPFNESMVSSGGPQYCPGSPYAASAPAASPQYSPRTPPPRSPQQNLEAYATSPKSPFEQSMVSSGGPQYYPGSPYAASIPAASPQYSPRTLPPRSPQKNLEAYARTSPQQRMLSPQRSSPKALQMSTSPGTEMIIPYPETEHVIEERIVSPVRMQSPRGGEIAAKQAFAVERQLASSPRGTVVDTRMTATQMISPDQATQIEIVKTDKLPPSRSSPVNVSFATEPIQGQSDDILTCVTPAQEPPRRMLRTPGSRLQPPGSRLQQPGSRLQTPGSSLQPPAQEPPRRMQRTPGSRLQPPGSRLQQPCSKLQQPGSRLQQPGSRLQQPGSRLQQPGSRLQQPDSRLQAPGSKLEAPELRLQALGSRLQALGSRLQAPCSRMAERRSPTPVAPEVAGHPLVVISKPSPQTCPPRSPGMSAVMSPKGVISPAIVSEQSSPPRNYTMESSYIPSDPAGATIDVVKTLLEEERQDVIESQTLSPELAAKLDRLKQKSLLEETLQETMPATGGDDMEKRASPPGVGAGEGADKSPTKSDVLASLMHSEECGVIDTGSSPKRTYNALFGAGTALEVLLEDERSVAVSPAAPAPLHDIVVPVGEATHDDVAIVSEELEEVAKTEQEIPKADAYSEAVAKQTSSQAHATKRESPKRATSPEQKDDGVKYIPRGELEEEKAPWDIDLNSLEDLVGAQMSISGGGERLPSDESIRATLGRFEYILDIERPKHYSCVQLRGTQPPCWFPGYYYVHPEGPSSSELPDATSNTDINNFVRLENDPSKVFAQMWNIFKPNNVQDNSELVIL